MSASKKNYKEKLLRRKEEKKEEPELPKYRDRAKERREDQNPDYEPTELGSFHSVAPPGTVDLRLSDAHKISIENSKYLGGDVEHTHLVKGLDYALLQKVRSEIDRKPELELEGESRALNDDQPLSFRTAIAKSVYQWIVKPQTINKANEMFLPGRMSFIFNMEEGVYHDIPTTLHRSKADCPVPEEMVTVSVDGSVLDRISKIMSYLRLGSSGKVLKKKKKDKDIKGRISSIVNDFEEDGKPAQVHEKSSKIQNGKTIQTAQPSHSNSETVLREKQVPRNEEDDIFVGAGVDYHVPLSNTDQSPASEDMDESPGHREKHYHFSEPVYGPVPPTDPTMEWQQTNGYNTTQSQVVLPGYPEDWQSYQYAEQMVYVDQQYLPPDLQGYDAETGNNLQQDPRFMTQEEKDRGMGSVFKRDDQRLQHRREKDSREKDPNFISDSYSECYPGYQDYNRIAVSDDEDDLSKMDMGGRAKGRLHRWDFETEEEWASYNQQKEAMPKAAFQFGVKMQDGRKTRKQNKDQKLTNELHKINKILARKKDKGEDHDDDNSYDDFQPGKKPRM